jgi:hypothetical protein
VVTERYFTPYLISSVKRQEKLALTTLRIFLFSPLCIGGLTFLFMDKKMVKSVGKYEIHKTLGEGSFGK